MCDCCGSCGCQGTAPATPEAIGNRGALSAVSYRAGRYATFRASMIAALAGTGTGTGDPALAALTAPLAALRTRDPADFTVALLDSWAVVLDILTFYSERVANEAFLRTAVEQRSVTELAALVGYVPSPGVSASATLAFTLADSPGAPAVVPIPAGTRVQSVPGPGQSPQVFETSAALTALAAWNAIPAQTTLPWSLGKDSWGNWPASTWFAGTANNLNAGDALLFVAAPGGTVNAGSGPTTELHFITAVSADPVSNATYVTWDTALSSDFTGGASVFVLRKKAALFGASAAFVSSLTKWDSTAQAEVTTTNVTGPSSYNYHHDQRILLDAVYPGIVPGTDSTPTWLALTENNTATGLRYATLFTIASVTDENPQRYNVTSRATALTLANPLQPANFSMIAAGSMGIDDLLTTWLTQTPAATAWTQSEQLTGAPLPLADWGFTLTGPGVPGMLVPVGGAGVAVTGGQGIASGQRATVSGKRVRLRVAIGAKATFTPASASGGSSVPDGQVFLLDIVPPIVDGNLNITFSVITLSGIAGSLTQWAGNPWPSLLPADKADPLASEAVVVSGVTSTGDVTSLTLAAPGLTRVYDRPTVTVDANAVLATHGETVQEILGSGDATNAALSFTLKQAPLTYLPASVPGGAQSTLQVWVNNLRWQQVPNFLGSGPADRVYRTSVDAAGRTVVTFGDGTRGARPPTGQANIRAVYRKGTGAAGMVAAGQLSQPLDRPQGLSTVTNPSAATGGADPATADMIRVSAPLPTLTLGRVVSLQDYQDFALAFAGITKALAVYAWSGDTRGVFLTVAGATGAVLTSTDPVITALLTALRQAGDPHVPLTIASQVPVPFTFTASVAVDTTAYDPSAVLSQAWQAVSTAFAFSGRGLGQGVAASEIIEVIQGVPGVVAVQLAGLERSGDPASAGTMLRAAGPRPPSGTQQALGAELLVLDPVTQGQLGAWS
jgi:hypothetical protein